MKEELLHYIWRLQLFNKADLTTATGQALTILHPGLPNRGAGPDFHEAHLLLDGVAWHGQVEIHVDANAWYQHGHEKDPAYNNTILHVVWEGEAPAVCANGITLPTLCLAPRVARAMLVRYQELQAGSQPIPCAAHYAGVPSIVKTDMLQKALFQRLTEKTSLVNELLAQHKNDWEAVAYAVLATSFGFKVNKGAFRQLSESLPLSVLQKHYHDLPALEALLFGQAGLLPASPVDAYSEALCERYAYLAHKYELITTASMSKQWHFAGARPGNFPTLRIAQLAQLLHQERSIFSLFFHSPVNELLQRMTCQQSAYWQTHYRFGKKSKKNIPGLGQKSAENLLINTAVPLLVAYGKFKDEDEHVDRAVAILESLPPEQNNIVDRWVTLGCVPQNAFDAQGYIELYNQFCAPQKCLDCSIGHHLLRAKAAPVLMEEALAH